MYLYVLAIILFISIWELFILYIHKVSKYTIILENFFVDHVGEVFYWIWIVFVHYDLI